MAYLNPEAVAAYPRRLVSNRTNPYQKPGSLLDVGQGGIESFETRHCAGGLNAILDPTSPLDPDFSARVGGDAERSQEFFDSIQTFIFKDQSDAASTPRPPCTEQAPYESIGSPAESSDYLHTYPFP
jgi:hypothetical protein